jgi:hypothetical protein
MSKVGMGGPPVRGWQCKSSLTDPRAACPYLGNALLGLGSRRIASPGLRSSPTSSEAPKTNAAIAAHFHLIFLRLLRLFAAKIVPVKDPIF